MVRPELIHRFKKPKTRVGEGILSNLTNKVASAIASNTGKKIITKTIDSVIENGTKKVGEFIVQELTRKRPGDLIREHFENMKKPPINEEEKYIQDTIDRILKL